MRSEQERDRRRTRCDMKEEREGPEADRRRRLAANLRRQSKEGLTDEPAALPMGQLKLPGEATPRAEMSGRRRTKEQGHDESSTSGVPTGDGAFVGDVWMKRRRPTPQLPLTDTSGRLAPWRKVRRHMSSPTVAAFLRGDKLVFYQQDVGPDGIVRWALVRGSLDTSGEVQWDCSDCCGDGIGSVDRCLLRAPRCPSCYAAAYPQEGTDAVTG
jgi:hypothetical protein